MLMTSFVPRRCCACWPRRPRSRRTRPAPSKAPSPTRRRAPLPARASSAGNPTPASRGDHRRAPTASSGCCSLPVGRYSVTVEAPQFATVVQEPIQVNVSQTVRVNVQLELSSLTETVTVSGGAQLVDTSTNALGPRRHRPRAGRPAAQRPQLHAARAAADRRRAAHRRRRHGRRQPASGAGLRGQRHAARAERLPGRRRAEHQPHGRRLRAEAAGRRDRRVPHPHAERAAGVRRHRRRHDERGHAVGRQPVSRQPLRVRAQRRLRRAQLLLRRGRAAQAEPVRRHGRRAGR